MTALLVAKADGELVLRVPLGGRAKLAIGRSPRCDLVLSAASISRHHALVFEHGGAWRLADTGSRTGVHGPDGPIRHATLGPDTWVRIGPAYLWLVDAPPPAPAPPPLATAGAPPVALRGELVERWLHHGASPSMLVASDEPARGEALVVADDDYRVVRRVPVGRRDAIVVGREPSCDLVIDDPAVSRLHCVLYREGTRWAVADAGATGGLRVDGRATDRRRLRPCMPVFVGGHRLFLDPSWNGELEDEEPVTAPLDAVSMDGIEPLTAAVSAFLDPESSDGASGACGWIREPHWPATRAR